MPNLFIIAGCNGAGKTTAGFTILSEILKCREFVNADSIAAGLSPFNPGSVAMEAANDFNAIRACFIATQILLIYLKKF